MYNSVGLRFSFLLAFFGVAAARAVTCRANGFSFEAAERCNGLTVSVLLAESKRVRLG